MKWCGGVASWSVFWLTQAKNTPGGGFCVLCQLALPRLITGRPSETVAFQAGAGFIVWDAVEYDLKPVQLRVADDLAAVKSCAVGALCGGGL